MEIPPRGLVLMSFFATAPDTLHWFKVARFASVKIAVGCWGQKSEGRWRSVVALLRVKLVDRKLCT